MKRAKNAALAYPIQEFHRQVEALDAAMLIARVSPKKGPVHDLRAAACRVEAYVAMLGFLSDLPPHKDEADKVMKRLTKVRQATNEIRDLDVQRELLRFSLSRNGEGRQHPLGNSIRRDSRKLREHLKTQRKHRSVELVRFLRLEERKLALALLKLEDALGPVRDQALTTMQLARSIHRWFQPKVRPSSKSASVSNNKKMESLRPGAIARRIEGYDDDALHVLRNRARLARYG